LFPRRSCKPKGFGMTFGTLTERYKRLSAENYDVETSHLLEIAAARQGVPTVPWLLISFRSPSFLLSPPRPSQEEATPKLQIYSGIMLFLASRKFNVSSVSDMVPLKSLYFSTLACLSYRKKLQIRITSQYGWLKFVVDLRQPIT